MGWIRSILFGEPTGGVAPLLSQEELDEALHHKHHTVVAEDIKALLRAHAWTQAEALLLKATAAMEAEARQHGWGVEPWYYDRLAWLYRRREAWREEIAILERFARNKHKRGYSWAGRKLLKRLEKSRSRVERRSERKAGEPPEPARDHERFT